MEDESVPVHIVGTGNPRCHRTMRRRMPRGCATAACPFKHLDGHYCTGGFPTQLARDPGRVNVLGARICGHVTATG